MRFRTTNRHARTIRLLVTVLVAMAATACATTPAPRPAAPPAPPPSVHMIEGSPEPDSAVVTLNKALADLKKAETDRGRLATENEKLLTERNHLQRQLAEAKGSLLALRTRVDELGRDQQEAMDALLASEIEKATLERRLLEIRLADLRRDEEGGAR